MWKICLFLILMMGFVSVTQAQRYDTPGEAYKAALIAIEEARVTGAIEIRWSRYGLVQLPSDIGQLPELYMLDLLNNGVNSIPSEIGQLTQLHTLHLSQNPISSLPPEIGQLSNLRVLGLNSTELSNLPSEIGQLTQLHTLYLSNSELTSSLSW